MNVHDLITVWRLTTHHSHKEEALQWAIQNNRLAIGWGRIGDMKLQAYTSPDEVLAAGKNHYPERHDNLSHGLSLYQFCHQMKSGDLVILKAGNRYALVMEVAGEYEYKPIPEANPIGDYQHQRKARILPIDAKTLWHAAGSKQAADISIYAPLVQCRNVIDAATKQTLLDSEEDKAIVCLAEVYSSADEINVDELYPEGAVRQVTVNAYERNPQARRRCIAHYGARCIACQLDFGEKYGKVAADFIHVHHLRPLADIGEQYEVNPIEDLRPVCPNCHAVIHRRTPPYSIEEIQAMLRKQSE